MRLFENLFVFLFAISILSCSEDDTAKEKVLPLKQNVSSNNEFDGSSSKGSSNSEFFFKENIILVDARIGSLSSEKFVRELYLANFSARKWSKDSIGMVGYPFSENGKGNDLVANDDIYTNLEAYEYSKKQF